MTTGEVINKLQELDPEGKKSVLFSIVIDDDTHYANKPEFKSTGTSVNIHL